MTTTSPAATNSFPSFARRTLNLIVLALLGVFLALHFIRPIEMDDVWWHLATGKYIFEHHAVPQVDPFPFGHEATPWIHTAWLGSLFYYLLFRMVGEGGLPVFREIYFFLTLVFFFLYARKRIPLPLLIPLIFAFAVGLETRCLLRPFIFNFIFVPIFLLILLDYLETAQLKRLWPLIPLGALWSNLHLGSFFYGYLMIVIFFLAQTTITLGILIQQRSRRDNRAGDQETRKFKDLMLILVLYPLSFILSPYGIKAVLHPWKVFFIPEYTNFYYYSNIISEMAPPTYLISQWGSYGFWFVVLLGSAIAALFLNRKHRLPLTLLAIISTFYYFYSHRNIDLFTMVFVYLITYSAGAIDLKKIWNAIRFNKNLEIALHCFMSILLAIGILRSLNTKIYYRGQTIPQLSQQEASTSPRDSLEALRRIGFSGRLFCSDLYGGYVIWRDYPRLKPFVDGRQVNKYSFMNYMRSLSNPSAIWPKSLAQFKFDAVLLDIDVPLERTLIVYLMHQPVWRIYFRAPSILFIRKDQFQMRIQSTHKETSRSPALAAQILKTLNSIEVPPQKPFESFWNYIFPPPTYSDAEDEGMFYYHLGMRDTASQKLLEAYRAYPTKKLKNILRMIALEDFLKNRTGIRIQPGSIKTSRPNGLKVELSPLRSDSNITLDKLHKGK